MTDLSFTSNEALTTEGAKDMEHSFNTLNEESLRTGLKIHKEQPGLPKHTHTHTNTW